MTSSIRIDLPQSIAIGEMRQNERKHEKGKRITEILCSLTGSFREREKTEKDLGRKMPVVRAFCHFSPHFRTNALLECVKRGQKGGEKLRFVQNHPELGGVEGVETLSRGHVLKSNSFITKMLQKARGLDRGSPTLQRNGEKTASRKREKKRILKNSFRFLRVF